MNLPSRHRMGCAALLLALASGSPLAADDPESQSSGGSVPVEVFKGPKVKRHSSPPDYPASELRHGREGWVILNMMISPKGEPYEVSVVDSTGNKVMEQAAVERVQRWSFEPASVNGQAVDSGMHYKVTFRITDAAGASRQFIEIYKRLVKAIEIGDKQSADVERPRLVAQNLYEDAFAGVADYYYAVRWGSKEDQLNSLRRAIAEEDSATFLPKDLYRTVLLSRFPLELELNNFPVVLETWKRLQRAGVDKSVLQKLRPTIESVEKLRTDATSYSMRGQLEDRTSWFATLFKRRFAIRVLSGSVSEIKLRCDKKYVFFAFQPDVEFTVADNFGKCDMEVVGQTGTVFNLIQS